jgi:hypothetical protein
LLDARVQADDVVFVYVLAHGAQSEDAGFGALKLEFDGEYVARELLVQRLRKLPARLVVLMTDNCSVEIGEPASERVETFPTNANSSIWRALYFGHRGFVDLVSTSKGQRGYIVEGQSLFARAFNDSLNLRSVEALSGAAEQVVELKKQGEFQAAKAIDGQAKALYTSALDASQEGEAGYEIVEWTRTEFLRHLQSQLDKTIQQAQRAYPTDAPADWAQTVDFLDGSVELNRLSR